MLSRQSDKPNIDFKLIEEEIKNSNQSKKVIILCKKVPKGFILNHFPPFLYFLFSNLYLRFFVLACTERVRFLLYSI